MDKKPTYNDLEKKVRDLEKKIDTNRRIEEMLKNEREQIKLIFDSINEPVFICDPDSYELLYVNDALEKIFGEGLGQTCYQVLQNLDAPCPFCNNDRIFDNESNQPYVWELQNNRTGRWFHCINKAIRWIDGRMVRFELAIDITERKRTEEALQEREKELEIQSHHLMEVNTALKVLLQQRENDKTEFQENVVYNAKELVVPYLEKLKNSHLDSQNKGYATIALSNLNDIISPFIGALPLKYMKLTPTEVQVANLIKHGNTTKDITELLNLSVETIKFHRKNIREKIGIKDKKINLRTYLLSSR